MTVILVLMIICALIVVAMGSGVDFGRGVYGRNAPPSHHPSYDALPMPPCTIVINTCAKYAATTMPGLLDSLRAARVPGSSVCVVIGACDGQDPALEYDWPGMRIVEKSYTWLDLTAMVAISNDEDIVRTPWILYLHDTSRVGPEFMGMLKKTFWDMHAHQLDACMLLPETSMNIGYYRTSWVRGLRLNDHMHHPSESQALKIGGVEDRVFDMTSNKMHLETVADFVPAGHHRYGDGVPRRVEYYPALDMYKYKSWFGQHLYGNPPPIRV